MHTLFLNLLKTLREKLENDLEGLTMCSFTVDVWSSRSMVPFQSLTIHYIDPEFKMTSLLLDCSEVKGDHTGVHLAQVNFFQSLFIIVDCFRIH